LFRPEVLASLFTCHDTTEMPRSRSLATPKRPPAVRPTTIRPPSFSRPIICCAGVLVQLIGEFMEQRGCVIAQLRGFRN
jgi:hypothetical protein